jgi:hypothetical protein
VEGKVQRTGDHVTIKADRLESFAPTTKVRGHRPTPRMLDVVEW